jgi:gamma-glutamyltranspeptidase/glutathione hydrolase
VRLPTGTPDLTEFIVPTFLTRPRQRSRVVLSTAACALTLTLLPSTSATAAPPAPDRQPTATGYGGAVASLDPYATEAGLSVLRRGGNAVDAAVAASAMLGLTRPYDGSIGGGGFFVIRDGKTGEVTTIDSREAAGGDVTPEHFLDPATGQPLGFTAARRSGLSVGVPGLVRGWEHALAEYGTMDFSKVLRPAITRARSGFVVDAQYQSRTESNLSYLSTFAASADTWLIDGAAPQQGTVFRNKDLAGTYETLAREGADAFYNGPIAEAIADTVTNPQVVPDSSYHARPGVMTTEDLASYRAIERAPTHHQFNGYDIYSMAPASSGGATVGQALNVMEEFDLAAMDHAEALHYLIEGSALAYADREAYLGDADFVPTPLTGLLSQEYAAERAGLLSETAAAKPMASGDPWPYNDVDGTAVDLAANSPNGGQTTHLTVADDEGTVVSYTFTIEGISGSGMTVPGHGFLLNNELTDFSFDPGHPANAPAGGKRPRSSMTPTIVTQDGEPVVALGTPGGARIITTVLQMLFNQLELGMTLPEAIAAPRLSQRNTTSTEVEAIWFNSPEADALRARGHQLTSTSTLNNVTGIAFLPDGRMQAGAEPVRLGGGAAGVIRPSGDGN